MISIIIPAYNEEKYIGNTLQSIKNQDFINYEMIVVCNSCTDKTFNIAKKYTSKVFNLKERNTSKARNFGAKKAKGEKLVFLDADIILNKDVLSEINLTNSFGTCKAIPSNRSIKNKIFIGLKDITNGISKYIPNLCGSNGIIFISKNLFDKLGGFNTNLKLGEERELMINAKIETNYVITNSSIILSTRRYDELGYLNIILFWIKEFFNPSEDQYIVVR